MNRAEVVRLDGAPGVGKTTRLFELVEEEKERGTALSELYYLTFARSGRSESADRLAEVYESADLSDIKKRAKTFHGAACVASLIGGVLDDVGVQVIQRGLDDGVYRQFATSKGMSYTGEKDVLRAAGDGKEPEGYADTLFAINDYLTLTRKPPEKYHHAPVNLPLPRDRVVSLLEAWDEFKRGARDARLFEHGDYVDEAIEQTLLPPACVLFIDEFQDLSPQEYLLFKTWRDSGEVDRIYIAGDPQQSIYSFRAGSPVYFEETEAAETEVRKKSYRCPEEIVNAARSVLDSSPEGGARGFEAASPGGDVSETSLSTPGDLASVVNSALAAHESRGSDATVFLLTRANYQAYQITRALRETGIPFEWLGSRRGVWAQPMPALLDALRSMKRGTGGVDRDAAHKLLAHAPAENQRRRALGDPLGDVYPVEQLGSAFADCENVEEVARLLELPAWKTDVLAAAASSVSETSAARVRVGTIHSAKGLEAPCVVLFDAYTPRLSEMYDSGENTAEEHRLYYVGVTRASKSLIVARDYFTGPTTPILEELAGMGVRA